MIQLIIFDLDGVLVESKYLHYDALARALKKLKGITLTYEDHCYNYEGLTTKGKLNKMCELGFIDNSDIASIDQLKQQFTKELIRRYMIPRPHITDLLNKLRKDGYKVACASNASRWSLNESLDLLGYTDKFYMIISQDDVLEPKPDPEIYNTTMSFMNYLPSETLILEDSPHGKEAAYKSGAHVLEIDTPEDTTIENVYAKINSIP
jgi:beta-phosphoglucomutase